MVYNGKSYSNGWFGGTPHFRKPPYIYNTYDRTIVIWVIWPGLGAGRCWLFVFSKAMAIRFMNGTEMVYNCSSIYLSINLSIYLSVYQSIYLSIYLSSIYHLSIYLSIDKDIHIQSYTYSFAYTYICNMYIYIYIHTYLYIWAKFNDLTVLLSPEIMVNIRGIIPKWPQVSKLVIYYNLPRI